MQIFHRTASHNLLIFPIIVLNHSHGVFSSIFFILYSSIANGFTLPETSSPQQRNHFDLNEEGRYVISDPYHTTVEDSTWIQSPTGTFRKLYLNTRTNVPVNNNNANPGEEPLSYKHPILYGEQATPIIETVTVTDDVDPRNTFQTNPSHSERKTTVPGFSRLSPKESFRSFSNPGPGPYYISPQVSQQQYPNYPSESININSRVPLESPISALNPPGQSQSSLPFRKPYIANSAPYSVSSYPTFPIQNGQSNLNFPNSATTVSSYPTFPTPNLNFPNSKAERVSSYPNFPTQNWQTNLNIPNFVADPVSPYPNNFLPEPVEQRTSTYPNVPTQYQGTPQAPYFVSQQELEHPVPRLQYSNFAALSWPTYVNPATVQSLSTSSPNSASPNNLLLQTEYPNPNYIPRYQGQLNQQNTQAYQDQRPLSQPRPLDIPRNFGSDSMILHQSGPRESPKVVPIAPLPSFRTIRNNPPGTTFVAIRRPDGSTGYTVDHPVSKPKPTLPPIKISNYQGSILTDYNKNQPRPMQASGNVISQSIPLSYSAFPRSTMASAYSAYSQTYTVPSTKVNSPTQWDKNNNRYVLQKESGPTRAQLPFQVQQHRPQRKASSRYSRSSQQPSSYFNPNFSSGGVYSQTQQVPVQPQQYNGGYITYKTDNGQLLQNRPQYPISNNYPQFPQSSGYSNFGNGNQYYTDQRSSNQVGSGFPQGVGQSLLNVPRSNSMVNSSNQINQASTLVGSSGQYTADPRTVYNNQAVRQNHVNYLPPSFHYDLHSPDKVYSQQGVFPKGQGVLSQNSIPTTIAGQSYRRPSVEEIQRIPPPSPSQARPQQSQLQQPIRSSQQPSSSPFTNSQTIPSYPQKSYSTGFGPQAYAFNDQDRSTFTGQTYQTPQKYNQWPQQQQQAWYAPPTSKEATNASWGYNFQGSQGIQSPKIPRPSQQGGSQIWTSSRNPSPMDGWNLGGYQTLSNPYVTATTPGPIGAKLDQPVGPSGSYDLQQGQWQNGTFVGKGSNTYINPIPASEGYYHYAQPGIDAKPYEVSNRGQSSLYQQNNNYQGVAREKESVKNTQKAENTVLSSSRGEVQTHTQPQFENNHGRLPQYNETKKDNELEINSAILQQYLQRAKQKLREQKSKQERASNNSIPFPAHSSTPTTTLYQQPSPTNESIPSSPSQPSPIFPGKRPSDAVPISPYGPTGIDASISHNAQPISSGATAPGTPGKASPRGDQDRADASKSALPAIPAPAATESTNVSPNTPYVPIVVTPSELSANGGIRSQPELTSVSQHDGSSRHLKRRRSSLTQEQNFDQDIID